MRTIYATGFAPVVIKKAVLGTDNVDCQLAEKNPVLRQWFDALIHFADVVFLTHREGVANKWMSDFLRRYQDQFVPSHFIQVKKTGIANPALVLEPEPRRVSQYFDDEEPIPADLVIVGIGIEPNVELAAGAGLAGAAQRRREREALEGPLAEAEAGRGALSTGVGGVIVSMGPRWRW